MSFSYLFDPNKQFQGRDGLNLVAGILRVYLNGTDDHATSYKNFDGGLIENDIVLDNDGRAVVIVDSSRTYRLEVRDRSGDLLWTTTGLVPGGGYIDDGISGLNYNDEAEAHRFVKSVSEANGVISVQRGQPVISDVDGLQTELDGKESTSNKKQSIDPTSTTEYPSSKAVADAITASRDTLKGINFYLEGESEPFAEYSPTANAATDVQIPVNVGNSAILEWDGTSRLYDDIEEAVGDGKIVFIKKDQYFYTLIEATASGRFCFVSMPTYYVVYYLEFYPSAHPTGFSETTQVNATAKYYTYSMTDEAIYTGTAANRSLGLQVFTDGNGQQYIYGGEYSDKFYYFAMNPENTFLCYEFSRTGTSPNYTYSRRIIVAQVHPVIKYVKTSSEYNDQKVVRVALCVLDDFSGDVYNLAQQAEFEIQCTTGSTTPNGNANSSFSMHVLVTAKQNGGHIKVDCRITGNNGWDFANAEPTISAYDTNDGNGVIVYFGLMKNGVWQDFEETYVTLVNLKPRIATLGTTDSVKDYADPTWHPETENTVWGHFENTSSWTTIASGSGTYEMPMTNLSQGAVGTITNNRINLPAGLYRFSLELAYRRSSSASSASPYYGYEQLDLKIKYGNSELTGESFVFNGVPIAFHMTEWSGGIFKLPSDGELVLQVSHSGGFSVDGNTSVKVSHVFINRIA